ncbi:hypothetical protein LUZ61_008732 [Rhynchospora tenuis]|uniref:NB-ARC domain-containing protein n=1 Tax=Rhynchospora tenuis TaxID=198213 RepID=A0AAD6EXQ9_9POAL|nr:hypothetical protein LUZ61_008732 [Rhynchospora tenuis]
MDNFLSQAVIAAIPSCIGPVLKNIAYPFNVSDNVKALDVATGKLAAAQADMMNRVHNDELRGFTQTNQVEVWLGRVERIRGEVAEIIKRHQERSRCLGKQFLNIWSNYSISKAATKKLTEVQELCEEGGKFAEVAIQLPPTVPELPVGSEVVVPQEETNLQEILRYINSDQYDIIGIWGMGGVGKTRLLHLVHNSYKGSSAFDVVAKVTASRECSVEKIQEELCEKCGFGRKTSVESQARIISDYLTNRNFLILLDDVWGHIDLEGVGIPLGLGLLDLDIFDARNIYYPGYDVIRKLLSACLLQEEGSGCVKVHDVIRDMALWIAHDEGKEKDKWVVLNGDESVLNHENIVWPRVERASLHFRLTSPLSLSLARSIRAQQLRRSHSHHLSLSLSLVHSHAPVLAEQLRRSRR